MTFLQINLALMTITVILATLMGSCLLYTMKTMSVKGHLKMLVLGH